MQKFSGGSFCGIDTSVATVVGFRAYAESLAHRCVYFFKNPYIVGQTLQLQTTTGIYSMQKQHQQHSKETPEQTDDVNEGKGSLLLT